MSDINNNIKIIDYCISKILNKIQNKKSFLVALTGESGSGKSHFTKILLKALDDKQIEYSFVNHDDFLIPRKEREALREKFYTDGKFKGKSYWEVLENWYYLDSFQSLIDNLKHNKDFTYFPYVHDAGEISSESRTIKANNIIILENKLFLEQMDFVIELRVDRKRRKIERDSDVRTPEQTIEMHEKAQGYFWDRCRPNDADIIIDNNDFNSPKIIKG